VSNFAPILINVKFEGRCVMKIKINRMNTFLSEGTFVFMKIIFKLFFIFVPFLRNKENAWCPKLGILFSKIRPPNLFERKKRPEIWKRRRKTPWSTNKNILISFGAKKHGRLTCSLRKHVVGGNCQELWDFNWILVAYFLYFLTTSRYLIADLCCDGKREPPDRRVTLNMHLFL
jgi:hypothetical protein